MTANVLGIAEGGEFMAESLNSARRQAKTNFYEINLRIEAVSQLRRFFLLCIWNEIRIFD